MAGVVRISEAANLGLHALTLMAHEPLRPLPIKQAVEVLGVSENHLAKVMQRLAKAGLVTSSRGPKGGFLLAKAPSEVTLLEIHEALEGPLPEHYCLLGKPRCTKGCVLGAFVEKVNQDFEDQLTRTRLSDVAGALKRSDAP